MANFKIPGKRASETVTFRLTLAEKHELELISKHENRSMTEVVRRLVSDEAKRLGLAILAETVEQAEPAAPTKPIPSKTIPPIPSRPTRPFARALQKSPTLEQTLRARETSFTLGELVDQFRDTFKDRAEGTRRELDETLRLLSGVDSDYPPLLDLEMPIRELTPDTLHELRQTLAKMNTRVAKKNLHLTYLRMLLHYAVKQTKGLSVNPAVNLASFTISELPKAWPGIRKS